VEEAVSETKEESDNMSTNPPIKSVSRTSHTKHSTKKLAKSLHRMKHKVNAIMSETINHLVKMDCRSKKTRKAHAFGGGDELELKKVPVSDPLQGTVPVSDPLQGTVPVSDPLQGTVPVSDPLQGTVLDSKLLMTENKNQDNEAGGKKRKQKKMSRKRKVVK
jgi:hypothetical protein